MRTARILVAAILACSEHFIHADEPHQAGTVAVKADAPMNGPLAPAGGVGDASGELRFDFDVNMDDRFDVKDRELKEKDPFLLGANDSDVDHDGDVDWHNSTVEDFENLRKCILRRFGLPSTNHSLWFTAHSIPIKDPETGVERIGQVRLFDSQGTEVLQPGESVSRKISPVLVANLATSDVPLYIEGVLGHDVLVGVELRNQNGKVVTSDFQRVSVIGYPAYKITADTRMTPYQTLLHLDSSTVIGDFAVANQLLEKVIMQEEWTKPQVMRPTNGIPPLVQAMIAQHMSQKNFIIVGGEPDKISTLSQLQFYVMGIVEAASRYRLQAEGDPAVSRHLLTLVRYFARNGEKPLDFRSMLELCNLAQATGGRSISAVEAQAIGDLLQRSQDALAVTKPRTEEDAVLFDKWKAALEKRSQDEQKLIHAVVRQLGSGSYKERAKAREALHEMGEKAYPVLKEYLLYDDPEVRAAARELLKQQSGGK